MPIAGILARHISYLFANRRKVDARRSFICVLRQGGFRVVLCRKLLCCDIVIFETTLGPGDEVSEQIIRQSINTYTQREKEMML